MSNVDSMNSPRAPDDPVPSYVREAIQLHLRDLEERYWEDEVVQEWENSKQATRPAAELWSELGL